LGSDGEDGGSHHIVQADEEDRLIEKLHKIEALFARSTTPGERVAAENAAERIRQRIRQLEKIERPIEFRFSLSDAWSRSLFVDLRRYGVEPYRYRGQRHTTVTAKVTRTFVNEVLWPEFQELNRTLREHLESVTARVIQQAIHKEGREVHERPQQNTNRRSKQDVFSFE
jgi:hypothetical protein